MDWQSSNLGSLKQQTAAAAAAGDDPWSSGLDLVAVSGSVVGDDTVPLLPLSDAGLDALLAPFEDWQYLLQPLGSAAGTACTAGIAAALPAVQPLQLGLPAGVRGSSGNCGQQQHSQQQPGVAAAAAAAGGVSPGTSSGGGAGGKAPRRKGGRPRLHHPKARATAAAAAAAGAGAATRDSPVSSSGCAAAAAGATAEEELVGGCQAAEDLPQKKSGRGPKPKYLFATQGEAADARRERNRKAALDSYYRKKEHTQRLHAEIAALEAQNAALQDLLSEMTSTGLCPLLEASNEGVDMWLHASAAAAFDDPSML